MTKKTYAIINLIIILGVIVWNYYVNVNGLNGNTVGSVSAEYANLFTPAGYAFSIWGVIYILLLAHGIFQVKRAYQDKKDNDFILKIGPWLIVANIANAFWLWAWLQEKTGLSVIIMLMILVSLIIIIIKLNMERWDAPKSIIMFVWWPICIYSGWITVATIANVAAWLSKMEWQLLFSEVHWTVIMIVLAMLINLLIVFKRNMREFAAVGVWALIAITIRHWGAQPFIQWVSLGCAVLLLLTILAHAFKNRKTNPFLPG